VLIRHAHILVAGDALHVTGQLNERSPLARARPWPCARPSDLYETPELTDKEVDADSPTLCGFADMFGGVNANADLAYFNKACVVGAAVTRAHHFARG